MKSLSILRRIRSLMDLRWTFVHMMDRVNTISSIEHTRFVTEIRKASSSDGKTLIGHGFKVYSQNDEDGIIQEIFKRIGSSSKTFVEFGAECGLENNTLKLLLEGWSGLWLEGSKNHVEMIERKFAKVIHDGRLSVKCALIDRDNINDLIGACFKGDIDLLSIDIDGNDIYILEAIAIVRPRVIVIEYNAKFPPPMSIAQVYDPAFCWKGSTSDYTGSSLSAIVKVAAKKGYSLVGCNITGINAFFVRDDLLAESFTSPFTAENHYQPARYWLTPTFISGHPADWGDYVTI